MKEMRVRLIERIKRTKTIESFRFQSKEKIDFIPGQYCQVIFDEAKRENKDLNKYLSMSSSRMILIFRDMVIDSFAVSITPSRKKLSQSST